MSASMKQHLQLCLLLQHFSLPIPEQEHSIRKMQRRKHIRLHGLVLPRVTIRVRKSDYDILIGFVRLA